VSGPDGLGRCVGDVSSFLRDRFTREPHRWADNGFEDLLSIDDVDHLLTGAGLRRPAVRLVHDGDVVDPARWTRRARTGATWVDDLVHPGRLLDQFAAGATVALQGLHRWWPPLGELCRRIELELGHAVQANAYLTPPGAAGLAPHHDTHDVFVLQVHGTKHWVVREPVIEAPLARHRSDHAVAGEQPVRFEAELKPGDCLYLPRGFVHSARAQTGISLHLTIGVLATTVHDLLRRLVDDAVDDVRFRRALPVGFGTDVEVAAAAVDRVRADLIDWLADVDVGSFAAQAVHRFAGNRAPLLAGQLLELERLDDLDDASIVERRPGLVWRSEVRGDRLSVITGDRRWICRRCWSRR
jgi:bifunctional lysine-specific demethylase and histidyl-hydroxylase NO66